MSLVRSPGLSEVEDGRGSGEHLLRGSELQVLGLEEEGGEGREERVSSISRSFPFRPSFFFGRPSSAKEAPP